ncbi:MAG: hypothetical protein K9K67_05085 [Bacteriovoracaceae bacterium]|nr:hypothetical protein [Bacteriovoracaceae bacterium]
MKWLLLCFLFITSTFADQYDDALRDIKKALEENHKIYKAGMEKSQKSRLENFFYLRDNARQVLLQSIYETAIDKTTFLNELISNLEEVNVSQEEKLYRLLIVKDALDTHLYQMEKDLENINKVSNSVGAQCSEDFNTKISSKYDPMVIYAIPTIEQTTEGLPKYNVSFGVNLSYNIDSNSMGYSPQSPSQEYDDDNKNLVVYGGAAIAQGVACFFGECTGYTFMIATAALGLIYDIFAALVDGDRRDEFKDQVGKAFAAANENIIQVHRDLLAKNPEHIKAICDKIDLELTKNSVARYQNTQGQIVGKFQKTQKNLQEKEEELIRLINLDRQLLLKMFGEKRQLFLKKYKNSLNEAREVYAQNGQRIFKYFQETIFPEYQRLKTLKSTDRLKQKYILLRAIVNGDVMFGENFTWLALRKTIEGKVQ